MNTLDLVDAFARMRKDGWEDNYILLALYGMFQQNQLTIKELSEMINLLGYGFSRDFENMPLEEKKSLQFLDNSRNNDLGVFCQKHRYPVCTDDRRKQLIIAIIEKWEPLYHERTLLDIIFDFSFGEEMKAAGFIMDCGHGLHDKYGVNLDDSVIKILDHITNIDDIGAAIFSNWRYYQHWAYSATEIYDNLNWFILMFRRLRELLD